MKKELWTLPLLILIIFLAVYMHRKEGPTTQEWQQLNQSVEGRLVQVGSPKPSELEELQNPFVIEEYPWGTSSTGWLKGWSAVAGPYAVAAENTNDIVAAVKFARKHGLKVAIKGTGHDYLGRSTAPHSLLIWTHPMRNVTVHDAFIPAGAPPEKAGVPAVTAEAGARWVEVYSEVTSKHGRYVQGGGCATVGAAGGFIQGGGFGSFSKKYGLGAASLLEAEVVLASGEVVIANEYQNADLLWALKGGGGGTFGVVSKVTLQTHDLPEFFGDLRGKISAKSDEAFQALLERFITFYRENLSNEHWGEQVTVKSDNSLELALLFQGLTQKEAEDLWKPFFDWVNSQPELYALTSLFVIVPAQKFWDFDYLQKNLTHYITPYKGDLFYWTGNQNEVLAYWYAMQSRWIPLTLFTKDLAQSFFQASRQWEFVIHFNKGLAGGSPEALERSQNTSINPAALDAAGLLIFSALTQNVFPGMPGHEPDAKQGEEQIKKVQAAFKYIEKAIPDTSTYSNEADYFQKNWQADFWGKNYPRLLQIKKKYDPDGFFKCHHCVGS